MRSLANISLTLFLLTLGQFVQAGERLEMLVKQPNLEERITIYLQGEQAKIVSTGNTNAAVLFNAGSKQLRLINHQQKSVTKVDHATIEQFASLAEGVGEIARSQGGVLGDLLKTFGLDNAMGEKAVIEHQAMAGEHQYSGVNCAMQQVSKDGQPVTQLCLTEALNLGAAEKNTLHTLLRFGQLLVQKGQRVLEQFNISIPQLPTEAIKGVPIYVKNIQNDTVATLVGLKQIDIPAGQFVVPAGYRETVFGF